MSAPGLESRLIELARRRGLLADTGSVRLTDPGMESPATESLEFGPRISALLNSGQLRHQDLQALVAELLQEPSFTVTIAPGEEPGTPETLSWLGYRDLRILGAGANALVYRAHDPRLGRWVALKFPQAGRFRGHLLKEARAQAKVDHPYVLKVLEVGEHMDCPFIALQLVEGGSLADIAASFSVETRVRLIKGAAEGLQAAHSQGLLHLDIKPDNILVDTSDAARPWPYLTGFGQVLDEAQQTDHRCLGSSPNAHLYTSPYASPEQLAGDAAHLDRRGDVFALGATLYTVLAGRPPFDALDPGEPQRAIPVPLRRNPSLPEDLEAITGKCLRRDPRERYPSARALADDLQRYLEGRPVQARPASMAYRLGKWTRRNRSLARLTAAALILLLGFAIWNFRAAQRQALRIQQADRSAKDVEGMEQQLRIAHLARLHDRRPEVAKVRETMGRILLDMATEGREAFGPCAYALGMGHATLGEWEAARSLLNAAWADGFRTPACAQIRGEVLTHCFLEAKAAIRTTDPKKRQETLDQLGVELRQPALASFQVLRQAGLRTPYQQAMESYLNHDLASALALADTAARQASWHYQADLLRCAILNEWGREALMVNDLPAAKRHYLAKLAIAEALVQVAPSDPGNWIVLGDTQWNLTHTESTPPWMERASQSYETALRADPAFSKGYQRLAESMAPLARAAIHRGEDPMPFYNRGVALAEESLRHDPLGTKNSALCEALLWRAQGIETLGGDPRPDLERAGQTLKELAARFPLDAELCRLLRFVAKTRAIAADGYGEDPLPFAHEMAHWAQETLQFAPGSLAQEGQWHRELIDLAGYELELGHPFSTPPAQLEQRIQDLLAQLGPSSSSLRSFSLISLGQARLFKAEERLRSGGDPIQAYESAMDAFRKSLHAFPEETPLAQAALAKGTAQYGACLRARGADPKPLLREGLASARSALASKPRLGDALFAERLLSYVLARCEGSASRERTSLIRLRQWAEQHPLERRGAEAYLKRWHLSM
ncbi:MAG: serine/threonine protein kinase [Acidobacteria bacterium]|nr:serine/threonine protein kinase [Acidobacteriota bacterium]MBI3486719.1 serine/threonine protein kinase [Acidobacteriota bacterium]